MKLGIRTSYVSAFLALAAFSYATEAAAKAAVVQFCNRIGASVTTTGMTAKRTVSTRNGTVRWELMQGNRMFTVDGESMEVTLYLDAEEEAKCRLRASGQLIGIYRNQAVAVAKARSLLQILSPGHSMMVSKFKADGEPERFQSLPRRNAVAVVLREADSGGRWKSVGNMLEVVMNGITGHIISITIERHWNYDPRRVNVTRIQAKEKARSILTRVNPSLLTGSPKCHLQYVIPISDFECSIAAQYQREKRARYAYCVEFEKVFVFIDAEDGKSLGGARIHQP